MPYRLEQYNLGRDNFKGRVAAPEMARRCQFEKMGVGRAAGSIGWMGG